MFDNISMQKKTRYHTDLRRKARRDKKGVFLPNAIIPVAGITSILASRHEPSMLGLNDIHLHIHPGNGENEKENPNYFAKVFEICFILIFNAIIVLIELFCGENHFLQKFKT